MTPVSLYIHTPWCIKKCPYCDFNSHVHQGELPETAYIKALLADFKIDLLRSPKPPVLESIFIGGGTPSLLSANAYDTLLNGLSREITFKKDMEITLEANPGTLDQGRFRDYRALGINRLSIGVQSFNPRHLLALGRIHDDAKAHEAIEVAQQVGFDNINIDLMHGLPNQTQAEALSDLEKAIAHEPTHLSWYELTIEPNTYFFKHPPLLPTEDACADMELAGFDYLKDSGFHRYEISAFAKPGKESHHNLNYWLFGDYYGIGAGAHSKLGLTRLQKYRQVSDYLNPQKPYLAEERLLSDHDLIFEFMLNTTRLLRSIDFDFFEARTRLSRQALLPTLQVAEKKGFLQLHPTHWVLTELGLRFTNDLQRLFLSA